MSQELQHIQYKFGLSAPKFNETANLKEMSMDPLKSLLKNGWITLLAAFAIVAVLALLPSRAGAADNQPDAGPIIWLS